MLEQRKLNNLNNPVQLVNNHLVVTSAYLILLFNPVHLNIRKSTAKLPKYALIFTGE